MVNEIDVDRATVVIIESTKNDAKVEFNGQRFTYAFSDKVKKYNSNGLQVGAVYDISYSADQNMMFYAKLNESTPVKKEVNTQPVKQDDLSERILAQSTLKEAVKITLQFSESNNGFEEALKENHKWLFKYMSNQEYKK